MEGDGEREGQEGERAVGNWFFWGGVTGWGACWSVVAVIHGEYL